MALGIILSIIAVVVVIPVRQNAAAEIPSTLQEDNPVMKMLEHLQTEINNRKIVELGVSSVQADLEAFRVDQSEASEQMRQHEAKIDSLLEQISALTNQLTQFFAVHSQDKQDGETDTIGGHNVDGGVPSVTLQLEATGGVAYVRWGRTKCRGDGTYVYKGFAASGRSTAAGGGSSLICLHDSPQWNNTLAAHQGNSPLVGVEYEFSSAPFSTVNNDGLPLLNNDMPCVLCHVKIRSYQMMIPGRKNCPSGWTMEYWGYLVATHSTQQKGSYTCVDDSPEIVTGGLASTDAHSVYPVESSCTALFCPPYFLGEEISCVICSR